ncbi:MAG TPA: hypothetical protein VE974_10780 [Thermoanaerobaculia bacterium]|nr:hypothetical protein [Thermoanaerobaculia bacterium]
MAETRIRIICHLPNNNARQAFVVHKVFGYLRKKAVNRHCGGFTHSSVWPTAFGGGWYSQKKPRSWVPDHIVVCMIDWLVDESVRDDASTVAEKLRTTIRKLYEKYADHPEEEVWIVAHEIMRLDN